MDRASSSKSRGKTQKRGLKARRTCVLAYSRQVGQKDKFWNSNCYSHLALLGKVIKAREEVFLLSKKKVETRILICDFLVRKTTDGELKKNRMHFFSSGNTFSNVIATQLLLAASSRLFFYTNKGCCFEYRHPFFIRRKYPVWKKEKYRCSAFFSSSSLLF